MCKITAILKQAQNLMTRHRRTKNGARHRPRVLTTAVILLWTILFAIMLPASVKSASWWDQIKEKGKQVKEQVIDPAIKKITPPSKHQQEQHPKSAGDSKPSYTKAQVRHVQGLLNKLGYKLSPVDGVYGSGTATAIRAYQANHNLMETGIPSDELIAHMRNTLVSKQVVSTPKESPGSTKTILASQGAPVPTTQTAPIQKTEKITPSTAGLDPLAPAGVRIGATVSDVDAALTAAGYKNLAKCVYSKREGAGSVSLILGAGNRCDLNTTLDHIKYKQKGVPIEGSPAEIVDRMALKLNQNPKCPRLNQNTALCNWSFPPVASLVKNIKLQYEARGPNLQLTLTAVDDLGRDSHPVEIIQDKTDGSTKGSGLVAESAAASQKGRLDIEGVYLGMTAEQIENVLQKKGYRSLKSSRAIFRQSKMFSKGPWKKPGYRSISIKYKLKIEGKNAPAENIIMIFHRDDHEQMFQSLVARHGEPYQCLTKYNRPNSDCTWIDQDETLRLFGSNLILQREAMGTGAKSGFAFEGLYLGMHRIQVIEVLTKAGYMDITGAAGNFRKTLPGSQGEYRINIDYSPKINKNLGPNNVHGISFGRPLRGNWEQTREELTAKFGPPDTCNDPKPVQQLWGAKMPPGGKTAPFCTWTRKVDGQARIVQILNATFSDKGVQLGLYYGVLTD